MKRNLKWIFTVAAILAFFILGSFLPAVPLNYRSMVVGLGVDKGSEKQLKITAQILTVSSNSESGAGSSSRILSVEGNTIAETLNYISQSTGSTVALTHCNVVLLGEDLLKSDDYYSCLDYLIGNEYLSENAYIFGTEGEASDILSKKVGFGNNASLYTQQLVSEFANYNTITCRTIKEYIVGNHARGKTIWLPYIKPVEIPPKMPSSESDTPPSKETENTFDLSNTIICSKNSFVGIYSKEYTAVINYISGKIDKGEIGTVGDNGENISFYVLNVNRKLKFDWDNKNVDISIDVTAMLKDIIDYSSEKNNVDRLTVTDTEISRCCDSIKTDMETFYSDMQSKNADIFYFEEKFYSQYGNKITNFNLSDIKINVNVKLKLD